jgi:ABC-2 type transport system permease protein
MSTVDLSRAHLSFAGVVRSEWIKLRTLRSTFWCYLIVIVLTIGLAALVASAIPADGAVGARAGAAAAAPVAPDSTWLTVSTIGVTFGQLVVAVLGALMITGEYGTGMIRSTFTAVPARLPAIAAKALVFGVVTFVLTLAALVVGALLAAPILDGRGIHPDLGNGSVWLALVGAAGYLTLLGILAMAIGLIIRVSAGAIATALGLVLVVPIIFTLLERLITADWPRNVAAFLPSDAGGRAYAYRPTGGVTGGILTLDGAQGLLVLAAWCVLAAVIGAVLVKRRDA